MADSLDNIQKMQVTDRDGIRKLYKLLKNGRIVLTYQEFSEALGYSEGYIPKVINGFDDLTDETLNRINKMDWNAIKNVHSKEKPPTTKEHIAFLTAAIKILTLSVVELKVKASIGATNVAAETLAIEKMIREESERLLAEGL